MGSWGFQTLAGIRLFKFCESVFPLNPSEALSSLLEGRGGSAAKPSTETAQLDHLFILLGDTMV